MLEFARWKYILVAAVLLLATIFALPNVFGEDAALQVARKDRSAVEADGQRSVEDFLRGKGVTFSRSYVDDGRLMLHFAAVPEQLKARDLVNENFARDYVTALSFASRAPDWLRKIGLRPMPLGLDLRGGLYLLYQVDVDGAVAQVLEVYEQDLRRALSQDNVQFVDVAQVAEGTVKPNGLRVLLPAGADPAPAREAIRRVLPNLTISAQPGGAGPILQALLTATQLKERQDYAISQNLTTIRNRVNELGVSEPVVQRQGVDRIAVQLPGVQNSAEVKDILGKVATLEFRLVDIQNSVSEAVQRGRAPFGSKLYETREGQPTLLKRDIIVTGDQLIDATTAATEQGPGVSVKLDASGGEEMLRTTRANLGKPMAVVFIEQRREEVDVGGQKVQRDIKEEKVINTATIQGIFSNSFQITGLGVNEARELALLLRAGALAAPIFVIEERVVGPGLGKENIEKGVSALMIGMALLFVFMLVYYKMFGVVANIVLLANVVLLAALLTMFKAALSLPGIAGIVLTVGMAVDANVLIYERIREEVRNGVTPQTAISKGFEKAFSSIADSNITTLIAGIVLWAFGTGPIRGFAVVLSLGIVTSMFTSLLGSRALLTLMYGGARRPEKLSI
ncbi:MAG: protein translocase subunit SecD [Gammaproteobacteria bacterium]|nr:protein translocase subunit SecD [Gammaproteobacteria bacterium]NDB16872.1 protein translocase subunit SecD [Gammaproteobacteria bacterium]NDB25972.1 protein translocase subunit SecD [Gammaproteobacteria bacterium]NDE87569.1 protein translocase subunit SecD [Gammaproteobacteria bacterium]